MNAQEIVQTSLQYNLHSWSKQKGLNPIPVAKAEGIYYYDFDGNRYSDMSSQLVNLNLGHGNRAIIDAIKEQSEKYCFISPAHGSEPRSELARLIIELMPDNMGKVFFTNGGADANENAIKIARMFTGRNKVFSRYRSYHGSSFGAGNLTGEVRRYPLEPGIPGFVKFFDPYVYREPVQFDSTAAATSYYLQKLNEQIRYEDPSQIAAIVLETVTGSNGVIIPPDGYLQGVRQLCDQYGILLVLDEVMTGFGRTGKMFGFENWGVKPDLVTFAKGVTCGYVQLGGVAVSKEIASYFDDNLFSCGMTYSGHPLACAAGVAALKYYKDQDILAQVQKTSPVLLELLESLKERHPCVGDVRAIGLFSAVELVRDKKTKEPLVLYGEDPTGIMKSVTKRLAQRKFMTYSHENIIIVAPPLIITPEQLHEEMLKLDAVLSEIDQEI